MKSSHFRFFGIKTFTENKNFLIRSRFKIKLFYNKILGKISYFLNFQIKSQQKDTLGKTI